MSICMDTVSYTHLDVYKRQFQFPLITYLTAIDVDNRDPVSQNHVFPYPSRYKRKMGYHFRSRTH